MCCQRRSASACSGAAGKSSTRAGSCAWDREARGIRRRSLDRDLKVAGLQYARDRCEAARLRANSSEKVFTKHADLFTKFSCLRDFATRRADHQGVRPLVLP